MASAAQVHANRANALHSTGPRSAEGKASVSRNACKHGLSSQYLPLSDAERPLFDQLEASLRDEIKPSGALQESVFRELAAAAWKRNVVGRLLAEAGASTESLFDDQVSDRVRKLQRHKADQDRAFNRALRQIKDLQTAELLRRTLLHAHALEIPNIEPETYPGLADYRKVTKQSQSNAAAYRERSPGQLRDLAQRADRDRQDLRRSLSALAGGNS